MPGLGSDTQADFSLGWCPGIAPHLIPRNGAAKMVNWLLDEDGSPYKRSGSAVKSAAFGSSGLTFLWDGWLAGGQRTVIANSNDFGVLGADDTSVVNLGGAGLSRPVGACEVAGMLFIDGGFIYGGSRKTSGYSTGTVAVTGPDGNGAPGSTTVVGTGTSWLANVDPGMLLLIGGKLVAVEKVTDDTHLELATPFPGATGSGLSYSASPLLTAAAAGVPSAEVYATVAGRLLACSGRRVRFSAALDPSSFAQTDYHELTDGVQILGAEPLGGNAIIFTTAGLWVIGNMAYELVNDFGDLQQPESREMRDLVLWSRAGGAAWQESLVAPAIDGVWLVTAGRAELLSRSIAPAYVDYVQRGYTTGIASVFRSHYLLPILSKTGNVVDLLVCRLDRPAQVRGQRMWPWTSWKGAGARVSALAVRVGAQVREPVLLGAEQLAGSRVLQLGDFTHDGLANDQDGSPVIPEIIFRDVATGNGSANTVKKFSARYELLDPDDDPALPRVLAYRASEARPALPLWGEMRWGFDHWQDRNDDEIAFTRLESMAPASTGTDPFLWRVNKRVRYARMRIKLAGGATRFVLRQVRLYIRPSGRM